LEYINQRSQLRVEFGIQNLFTTEDTEDTEELRGKPFVIVKVNTIKTFIERRGAEVQRKSKHFIVLLKSKPLKPLDSGSSPE